MKEKVRKLRSGSLLILSLILVTISLASIDAVPGQAINETDYTGGYTSHGPFNITCNEDFEIQGWNGSGSFNEPYTISGLNITSDVHCVSVRNTTSFFVVSDCLLTSATRYPYSVYEDPVGSGIYLSNVSNGIVERCYINWKYHGISAYNSSGCSFDRNVVHSNMWCGIRLNEAPRNTVTENIIYENGDPGIWAQFSPYTIIDSNIISGHEDYGTYLLSCDNSSFINNIAGENGRDLFAQFSSHVDIQDNIVRGGEVGFRFNQDEDLRVINNSIENMDDDGMYVDLVESSVFENNLVGWCSTGFWLDRCVDCQFLNNTIEKNDKGIYASGIRDCLLTNNTLSNYGINIWLDQDSADNAFYWNTVSGEADYLAQDDGLRNLWDDNVSLGNKWGDYIGFGVYPISGAARSVDRYPLGFRTDIQLVLLQGVGMLGVGAIVTVSVYYFTTRKPKQHIGAPEQS